MLSESHNYIWLQRESSVFICNDGLALSCNHKKRFVVVTSFALFFFGLCEDAFIFLGL